MGLMLPWALPATVVLVLLAGAAVALAARRRRAERTYAVANTDLLRAIPEYRTALRRGMLRAGVLLLTAALTAAAVGWALARPRDTVTLSQPQDSRDIVLCLDVSGSMGEADAELLGQFRTLARQAKGDRISLVIFNSTSVPVFPLTDDDGYVDDQLAVAERAFTTGVGLREYLVGTYNSRSSSLIGDGLATCMQSFDHLDTKRARSVVLATDNEAYGSTIFTLTQAGRLSPGAGIRIYGINPDDSPSSADSQEMRAVCESSGGLYFPVRDVGAVDAIVTQITSREASRLPGRPQTVEVDDPTWPLLLAGLGVLALVGLSRRWRR